jgi:lysine-N-methylase
MHHKIILSRYPDYLKKFQCIGPLCSDNCCIGWDVDIDKKTYFKYQKVNNEALMPLFRKYVHQSRDAYSDDVDFARVKLLKDKRCPFLNAENLCRIQAAIGESYLSNVCATYPRFTNQVDDCYEYSATVSCPEAARLILLNRQGLVFVEEAIKPVERNMLMYQADTTMPGQNRMVTNLIALRQFTMSLLQNRTYGLAERLMILGYFFNALQNQAFKGKANEILALIRTYTERIRLKDFDAILTTTPLKTAEQMKLVGGIAKSLNIQDEIDSRDFIAFTEEFRKGIFVAKSSSSGNNPSLRYEESYRDYYVPFVEKHGYILENYLVNYVFSSLFPAGESTRPFEAYSLLAVRFALIKYYLIGIGASRRGLTSKLTVAFIQSFAKAIEHHKTFLEGIPAHLKRERHNTLADMLLLLKN